MCWPVESGRLIFWIGPVCSFCTESEERRDRYPGDKVSAVFQNRALWPLVGGTTGALLRTGKIRRFPALIAD
jgi:hypothetical protein